MIRWTTPLVLACSLLLACSAGAAENGESLRRWAVVADSQVQQTGLPDLLTARLGGKEGWELVERDQLSLATRELELSLLSEGSRASERLKLGRILSADALVLLSRHEAEGKTVLKLVVSECNYGARLTIELVDLDEGRVKEAVARIEASLERVRGRFQQGIDYLIGVPHFVSRNLTHDYDGLQSGYAYLLQAALAARPGVAALEVEEARAIGRELALSANPGLRRAPLLLLDAEYVIERPKPAAAPQVKFDLKIRNGDEVRSLPQRTLRLDEAADFVTRELPPQLVKARELVAELKTSPEQQFSWLVERANAFSQLGEWRHATGLREAALLLRPRDVGQRKALIHDYERIMTRPLHEVPREQQKPGNPNLAPAVRERVDAYLAALSHFEHLIRQREISHDEVVKRFHALSASRLRSSVEANIFVVNGVYWRMGQEFLVLAEEAEERFLTECYAGVIAMAPQEEGARREFVKSWQQSLIAAVFDRVDRTYRTHEDLKFLERVLTQILPDGPEVPSALSHIPSQIGRLSSIPDPKEAIKQEDWDAFLERLSKSEHRVAAIFARYTRIRERRERGRLSLEESRSLLAEVESLLKAYDALGDAGESHRSRKNEFVYSQIRNLHFSLKQQVAPTPRPALPSAGDRPAGWEKDPEMWKRYGYPTTMGKLKFEPIDLKLKSESGEAQPLKNRRWRAYSGSLPITDVTACGDRFDVWWNPGAVLVMREKGILEEVAVDPQPIFTDVKWDGRHIWIGTRRGGLWVVDPESLQVVVKIGEEAGLPPSDRKMMLHPAGPGRVCVIGAFGEHSRAWCALVSWNGGTAQVKVFHEATHVPSVETWWSKPSAEPDLHVVFEPAWLHEYDSGDDRRHLLVGRRAPTLEGRSRPLLIDLDSLDVRSFGHTLYSADHRYSSSYYSRKGHLLEASESHIVHRPPPGKKLSGGEDSRLLCTNVTGTGLISKQILSFDGWLYVPGDCWFRLHPDTFDQEMLVPGRLPNEYSMRLFSVSVHYGLLAWTPGKEYFFQVLIRDSSSTSGTGGPSK